MTYLEQLEAFKNHMLEEFYNATGDNCSPDEVSEFFNSTFKISFRGKQIDIPVCAEVFGAIEEIINFEIEEMKEL